MLYGLMDPAPRYSARAFPPYRFVPGKAPHPTRSPDGHSYGRVAAPITIDEHGWRACEQYLYAIDLFNHGYYWEAHEVMEGMWQGAGRETPIAVFSQALIQAAAALLKHAMGELAPASRLGTAAREKLAASSARVLGVDTRTLAAALEAYLDGRLARAPTIELEGAATRDA